VKAVNEERVRELESWCRDSREGLTTSECVLLDAIAETCAELRRMWALDHSKGLDLDRLETRVLELQDALRGDRRAMEAAELELALGASGSADRARERLANRLEALDGLDQEATSRPLAKPNLPGLTE
jgi:hypothetical protein